MTIIKINGGFWGWEPIETLERLYPLFEQYTLDPIYEWYGNFVNRKPEWQRSEERQAYQGCTVISGRFLHYGNFFYIVTDEEELIQRFERLVADNKATQAYQDERKVCFPCSECNQWSAASGLCGLTAVIDNPSGSVLRDMFCRRGKSKVTAQICALNFRSRKRQERKRCLSAAANGRFNNGLEQSPQETRWPLQASGAPK